jgi:mRNA interferase YafQ
MSVIKRHKQFLKDFAKISISDNHFAKLVQYIALLLQEMLLPPEAHDHSLEGKWGQYREFHIGGDMLVIYKIENKTLFLVRIGTHNQLFR